MSRDQRAQGTSFGKVCCVAPGPYFGFGVMRRSSWTPSIVPNDRERKVLIDGRDKADVDSGRFEDPSPAGHFLQTLDRGPPEEDANVIQRRSDLALLVGTVFALALPVILGLAVYLATRALLRA